MDIQMPEMDGLVATEHIRTTLDPENQPYIIAMTAGATQHDRERCVEAGMDDYLAKPVSWEDIAAALDRFIDKKNMAEACRIGISIQNISGIAVRSRTTPFCNIMFREISLYEKRINTNSECTGNTWPLIVKQYCRSGIYR